MQSLSPKKRAAGPQSKIAIPSLEDGWKLEGGEGCRVLSFSPSLRLSFLLSLRPRPRRRNRKLNLRTAVAKLDTNVFFFCLLETLLTAPRALFLHYTILPCSAPRGPFHCLPRESHHTRISFFSTAFAVPAQTRWGAVDRRLSPFITCYLRRRVASGLAHFRANMLHVCQRPNILSTPPVLTMSS